MNFYLASTVKYFAYNEKTKVKKSCTRFCMSYVWLFGEDGDACFGGM